jgi:hypothetical protein
MHASIDFTAHMLELLKKTGPSGPTGPTSDKPLIYNDKAGTTRARGPGPLNSDRSHLVVATGPGKGIEKQALTGTGTSGTTGTGLFAEGEDQSDRGGSPCERHAILAELERRSCPDWLTPDRWEAVLSDAENFLSRWGAAAHALGWTAADLFGVHPVVPGARFDVMGLLLLICGGEVIAVTERSATIRRISGAVLTYRRSDQAGAVLLSEIQS